MTRRWRVIVADDHLPARQAVRQALDEHGAFEVCAESSDAAGAVAAALRERPDLCLLDIRMPGMGIAAAWEISSTLPRTKIVMFTVSRDDHDLFASLRAGACAYLLKGEPPEALPEHLMRVLSGESPIHPSLVARMVEQFHGARAPRRRISSPWSRGEPLSSREWEVLELLHQGCTTRQIADRLVLSQSAVRSHVGSILRKLRVSDRNAAIRLLDDHAARPRAFWRTDV